MDDCICGSNGGSANVENKCLHCGRVGTSDLNHHIPKCSMTLKSVSGGDLMIDHAGVKKLDKTIVRDLMTQMIIQHDLPFQFVEWDGFRAFTKYIFSDEAQCVSTDTVTADVMKLYLLEKEKLKNQLATISGRVCLTFRCWSSITSRGYITLTAHYVDEDWKLNVKLLKFCHLGTPHNNLELSRKVYDYLCEWGIHRKIFSITVDNASSNDELENLKELLSLNDGLLSNGEFFYFKCGAHVLDLIVQESLKVVDDILHKIRESVKYVSASFSRLKQFHQCVEDVGGIDINKEDLHLDVSAKWKSTYVMLKSAVKYRRAFERLHMKDMDYSHMGHCPSDEEWERGEKICGFLENFYKLSDMMSGSTYRTPNTYFTRICWIEISLTRMKLSEDHKIRDMASKMLGEFNKYLSEYSMILAFGFVLDPDRKFSDLEYTYFRLYRDMNVVKDKVSNVKKALYALFNEYAKKDANKGASTSSSSPASTHKRNSEPLFDPALSIEDEYNEYCERKRQKRYAAGMTQLDEYLEEGGSSVEALDYWKNNSRRLDILARMARDVLSIPIITVASESGFSIGGSILNKYRSCMLSENLQALVCSHNWLFGFSRTDRFGDVIEEARKIDINLSKQESNVTAFDENEDEDS